MVVWVVKVRGGGKNDDSTPPRPQGVSLFRAIGVDPNFREPCGGRGAIMRGDGLFVDGAAVGEEVLEGLQVGGMVLFGPFTGW